MPAREKDGADWCLNNKGKQTPLVARKCLHKTAVTHAHYVNVYVCMCIPVYTYAKNNNFSWFDSLFYHILNQCPPPLYRLHSVGVESKWTQMLRDLSAVSGRYQCYERWNGTLLDNSACL